MGIKPKICVPLMGKDLHELNALIKKLTGATFDLVEWRVDGLEVTPSDQEFLRILKDLRAHLGAAPILLTYRTALEGGNGDLDPEHYCNLLKMAIQSGCVDLLDVELQMIENHYVLMNPCLLECKKRGIELVISKHDFKGTPSLKVLESWADKMRYFGADVLKIAVMAESKSDALKVMALSELENKKSPELQTVFIAMGNAGLITRYAAEFMGSALVFASLDAGTGPGQMPIKQTSDALDLLHQIMGFEN